ncbi:GntP family permease [Sphingobacterium sp. BIGb0165]|uniref:GntP family permease n=1 Tax=Sphingobacterium sp. BIGb0165 TaxID=2940615 RepID=UPI0021679DD8|nr:GntP family permease [Sphingobacterium sp. BIGb0165]MCS4223933.1 Gnt-I system high-affinity gluconate transporter [Sphingobacterium sp. BIGb0165]
MTIILIVISICLLILCITYFKINAFLSFLFVSILSGLCLGIAPDQLVGTIEKGIAGVMGSLTLIIVLGAMLGKIVAESGAAEIIAVQMVRLMGEKYLQWGLMLTGFVVGIPLFYGIGFVLLVPLIFSISYRYKLPAVYIGLPMLAALSVTHGFIPPHPSPVALVALFHADMGLTLIYGILIAIPAIILGGPIFGRSLRNMLPSQESIFRQEKTVDQQEYKQPTVGTSLVVALLPVLLIILFTLIPYIYHTDDANVQRWLKFIGSTTVVMVIAIVVATYLLGLKLGRSMVKVMSIYESAVKDIAMILLIIAGSGVFKQVMEDSGVSLLLANTLQQLPISPLLLAWLITAVIRGCVGSATVAALTAAGVLLPIVTAGKVDPNLMVLAIGAGSLMFSHVNDAGFWLFKEYFGLSVKDTLFSWSIMEAIVSIVGLVAVLLLQIILY